MKKIKIKIVHWCGGIIPEEIVPAKQPFEIIKTELPIVTLQMERMYDEDFYTIPIIKEEMARQLADDIIKLNLGEWQESIDYDTGFKKSRITIRIAAPRKDKENVINKMD